ncbi:MAG: HD family phosphohydrolase [Thermoguttaceae bacterium]
MSVNSGNSSHQIRTRSERVAGVVASRGHLKQVVNFFKNDLRFPIIIMMLLTNLAICVVIEAWKPPFSYQVFDIPTRDIVCQTPFRVESLSETDKAKENARMAVPIIYTLDSAPIIQIRDSLINSVITIAQTTKFEDLNPSILTDFLPNDPEATEEKKASESLKIYSLIRNALSDEHKLTEFQENLKKSFVVFERDGFLLNPPKNSSEQIRIIVPNTNNGLSPTTTVQGESPPATDTKTPSEKVVYLYDVLLNDGNRLRWALAQDFGSGAFSNALFNWVFPKFKNVAHSILRLDVNATTEARNAAVQAVQTEYIYFPRGKVLVPAGTVITPLLLSLLKTEYDLSLSELSVPQKTERFSAIFFLLTTPHFLGWVFLYRRERRKPKSLVSSSLVLGFMFLSVLGSRILLHFSDSQGHLDLIPLLIFAQCMAITFSWELSLILSMNLVLALVFASDCSRFSTFLILSGTMITAVEQLGRLRTRSKLIIVGMVAATLCAGITVASGILEGRQLLALCQEAFLNAIWTLVASLAMTGLLPFIERPFGILTDMSLLELGDVSHPLLQEMIRRAPATYSHSIQVGSVAEAASDAIGARGLLTRVGAYFHDIGKILKPQCFVENQTGENIHDSLEPHMSSIVIVAHVKDGVDLARQHRLPQPLIDLIEQHHGTSLVSYFYGLANRQSKDNPYGQVADESAFRYAGPKPQTKEAGILMLADAAESAVRSMGDSATPGRIENMVRQITELKLKDGQFDECGMTLRELKIVENSIINSLIAVRHSRIKYHDQDKNLDAAEKMQAEKNAALSAEKNKAVKNATQLDSSANTVAK